MSYNTFYTHAPLDEKMMIIERLQTRVDVLQAERSDMEEIRKSIEFLVRRRGWAGFISKCFQVFEL